MSCSTSSEADRLVDSRLNYWVQHIAKIMNKNQRKVGLEDVHQIRFASLKLLQCLQQLDKPSKDAFVKNVVAVDTLISVLQAVTCEQTLSNMVSIFIDIAGKQPSNRRISVLVSHGLTTVLFQILKLAHTNDLLISDDLLIDIHVLLSRIGHKDRKFAVKARLHQSLMLTLNLVKSHSHNFRNLQALLQVLKLYTNNSVNASYLGKHNAVNCMLKILSLCGKRHTVDLKLALENLFHLTKSKSNAARLISVEGIAQLLELHSDWQQLDSKLRNLAIRRSILLILKNITNLRAGRKAFVEANGIRVLYESALEASDCRDMEGLILLASIILRKCCPKNRLPLESSFSPVVFSLPPSAVHTPECFQLPDYPGHCKGQASSIASAGHTSLLTSDPTSPEELSSTNERYLSHKFEQFCGAFYSLMAPASSNPSQNKSYGEIGESSGEEDDDDIDSDDERFRTDPEETDDEVPDPRETRTFEDLRMYDQFFPELLHLEPPPPKVVPLALPVLQRSQSGLVGHPSPGLTPMKHVCSDASLYVKQKGLSRYLQQHLSFDRGSVSAINVKTGACVISLDTGLSPSRQQSKGKKKCSRHNIKATLGLVDVTDGSSLLRSSSQDIPAPSLEDEMAEELLSHDADLYSQIAADTHSVLKFQKLAFPDLYGVKGHYKLMEPLASRRFGVQRSKIFEDIDRMIHADQLLDRVVYDLDKIISEQADVSQANQLSNNDELRLGFVDPHSDSLKFNAQFECGNLRKVVQVRQFEYDLILSPDINSNHHHQWFYFEISNMRKDQSYRFNIVNCEKLNSQFNFGMQPLLMSVMEALEGNPCWARVGYDICYYRNHFLRNATTTGGVQGKSYYTATFSLVFPNTGDICYLSYHYPYTYTALKTHLKQWENHFDASQIFYRQQTLCTTLGGNDVPVLTITAQPHSLDAEGLEEFRSRPYIFLTSRVHPGESNASWVMKGTIDFLLSKKGQDVRENFIFKIVPMLNPDGVINGSHRSSLVGEDLNRRWGKPCSILHPTIYHTKGLLQYLSAINKPPLIYCDYHGHSRRKNIFMYGCSPHQTWQPNESNAGSKASDQCYKQLPRLLQGSCPSFSLQNCSFVVEKVKESTARVVVWRQIGVSRSYTMEASYCGCDQGKYKDMQMNTEMLEEMGQKLCETLNQLPRLRGEQQMPALDSASFIGTSEDPCDEQFGSSSSSLKKKSVMDSDEDDSVEECDEEFDEDG
ncbi:cytosolic carboxypeptidase 1-like isoform X2 [Physella acuta]|uniref:cytosolic carboxypeptidase 1-like isoform X2 n=1 Tax=Physella acuta TaxID=109671 RepID=UPI0027DE7D14|nr:cytosolic carboxypeptidase 1-like isoform X2 [Physella acuta]XP_059172179.1 cytosolic carboxypeptidase 1-like isoform X2 [Physella acuta]